MVILLFCFSLSVMFYFIARAVPPQCTFSRSIFSICIVKARSCYFITVRKYDFSKTVGGLQISSANHKSTNLSTNIFYDLWTFCKCDNLWICDLQTMFFCYLRICNLWAQLFSADLKFLQIHNFIPYKYKLKMLSFKFSTSKKFRMIFGFWDSFVTEIHGLS